MDELRNAEPDTVFAKAETYMKTFVEPKSLSARLNMWNFKDKWDGECEKFLKILETQRTLYEELKSNEGLHNLLGRILAIGNVLNGGTVKG